MNENDILDQPARESSKQERKATRWHYFVYAIGLILFIWGVINNQTVPKGFIAVDLLELLGLIILTAISIAAIFWREPVKLVNYLYIATPAAVLVYVQWVNPYVISNLSLLITMILIPAFYGIEYLIQRSFKK